MAKGMRNSYQKNEDNAIERCDYNGKKTNNNRFRTVKFIADHGPMKLGDILPGVDGWTAAYLISHGIAVAVGKR